MCLQKKKDLGDNMGLDIWSTDDKKHFHIGYIGFTTMRSFFILFYGKRFYDMYMVLARLSLSWRTEEQSPVDKIAFDDAIGDLNILINHSDCDGELTSEECKLLKDCLFVDKEAISEVDVYSTNPEYVNRIIGAMYDFIDIVEYCAENDDVKLIFG